MKHNNVLPNQHTVKDWHRDVKTWFDQPARAIKRRQRREEKRAKMGVRPVKMLKPLIQCPTQRFNWKTRLGRGFTTKELKACGIKPEAGITVGITWDKRRMDQNRETFDRNVARIKDYLSRLVIFPRKDGCPKKGQHGLPDDVTRESVEASAKLSEKVFARFAPPKMSKLPAWSIRA